MDAGPGTDLGGLGWFVGVWVTMMAAMMLPSAVPMVRGRPPRLGGAPGGTAGPAAATSAFVAGYLAAWTAYGLVAYGLFRAVVTLDPAFLAWDRQGPLVAAGGRRRGGPVPAHAAQAGVPAALPHAAALRSCTAGAEGAPAPWRWGPSTVPGASGAAGP